VGAVNTQENSALATGSSLGERPHRTSRVGRDTEYPGERVYRLVVVGFGNVGQGVARVLRDRGEDLARQYGVRAKVVAVSDPLRGNVYDPEGLAPEDLINAVEEDGDLDQMMAHAPGSDALDAIATSNADVVIELSYTDLVTGEPALSHVRRALEYGRHVVTTNKGPLALHYGELSRLASENGVMLGVEGTVMSGTPVLHLGREMLAPAGIRRVEGILNGTTNYILSRMEVGEGYEEALRDAQERGYAEADPTGDVEGFDAAAKVAILANLLMGEPLALTDVRREGITGLDAGEIASAPNAGHRWKLVGKVERAEDGKVAASVGPTPVALEHPLASVRGAMNALTFTTDLLGDVTVVGPGAGREETAYAVIGDLLAIHQRSGVAAGGVTG
jgi:homoserine dehydrogenase